MTSPLDAQAASGREHHDAGPRQVAESFLSALAAEDVDAALELLDEDVVYANQGLPTIEGRGGVGRVLRLLDHDLIGFDVHVHTIAVDGSTVLTERTDVHRIGPLEARFWVCGRYDVVDGRLTVLREYFDFVDILRAVVRAVVGIVVPSLAPTTPVAGAPRGR